MNALTHILARSGLLTRDLDYHLIRASMVLIFLAFGYQKWFAYEAQFSQSRFWFLRLSSGGDLHDRLLRSKP